MGLSFIPLGVGDAFSRRHYSSSFLVESGGTRLLVDCPHPIRKILGESAPDGVDLDDIDAVVLTHLHADHASGLEGYGFFCHFALGRRGIVLAHPRVSEPLWEHLRAGMGTLFAEDARYRYHPFDEWLRGRDEIVESWLDEPDEPGTYDATYEVVAVDGDVAVATGTSTYSDPEKTYDNCFVMRFDRAGLCIEFTEWFVERPE